MNSSQRARLYRKKSADTENTIMGFFDLMLSQIGNTKGRKRDAERGVPNKTITVSIMTP